MRRIAKAIAALLVGAGAWAATALSDGHISPTEWGMLGGVVASAFAVYQVRNAPPKG